jgi:hypothetical protein
MWLRAEPDCLPWEAERHAAVTAEDLARVMREHLDPARRVLVSRVPSSHPRWALVHSDPVDVE